MWRDRHWPLTPIENNQRIKGCVRVRVPMAWACEWVCAQINSHQFEEYMYNARSTQPRACLSLRSVHWPSRRTYWCALVAFVLLPVYICVCSLWRTVRRCERYSDCVLIWQQQVHHKAHPCIRTNNLHAEVINVVNQFGITKYLNWIESEKFRFVNLFIQFFVEIIKSTQTLDGNNF